MALILVSYVVFFIYNIWKLFPLDNFCFDLELVYQLIKPAFTPENGQENFLIGYGEDVKIFLQNYMATW